MREVSSWGGATDVLEQVLHLIMDGLTVDDILKALALKDIRLTARLVGSVSKMVTSYKYRQAGDVKVEYKAARLMLNTSMYNFKVRHGISSIPDSLRRALIHYYGFAQYEAALMKKRQPKREPSEANPWRRRGAIRERTPQALSDFAFICVTNEITLEFALECTAPSQHGALKKLMQYEAKRLGIRIWRRPPGFEAGKLSMARIKKYNEALARGKVKPVRI